MEPQSDCCFLCLQERCLPSSKGAYSFLRNLSRFLELFHVPIYNNQSEDLRRRLRDLFSNSSITTVKVCQDCSGMTSEFTELYHLLEVTKLRVNGCVRKIHDVITKAEEKTEAGTGSKLDLRNEAIGLLKAMTPTPPTVSLQKMRLPSWTETSIKLETKVDTAYSLDDDYSPSPSPDCPNEGFEKEEEEYIPLSKSKSRKRIRKKSPSNLKRKKPKITSTSKSPASAPLNKSKSDCPYCKARIQKSHRLTLHILQYHCDHFFPMPKHKLPQVTEPQFRKILSELLFKDLIDGRKVCAYCDKGFTATLNNVKQIATYKNHYVTSHFKELEEDLQRLQEDPELETKLEEINPEGKFCKCGVYLSNRWNESLHEQLHCTLMEKPAVDIDALLESHDASNSNSNKSKQRSCSFCNGVFQWASEFKAHMIQYHCQHLFPHHKLDSVSDQQFQKILVELLFEDAMEGCPYCGKCLQRKHQKLHVLSQHYQDLEMKLQDIQNDPNLSSKLASANPQGRFCECGIYISSSAHQVNHDQFYCTVKLKSVALPEGKRRHRREDDGYMLNFDPVGLASSSNKKQVACKLCGRVMTRMAAYKHWNYSCPMGKRLTEEKKETKRSIYSKQCPHCLFQCGVAQHTCVVQRHLVRFHPEHFFLHEGEESKGRVEVELFQKILVDVIFPECIQRIGKSVSCRLCEANFLTEHETKKHIVLSHKMEVIRRVEVIKQDKSLEVRLRECNPNGVVCPCGVYLPKGGNSGIHQKFCKFKLEHGTKEEMDGEAMKVA